MGSAYASAVYISSVLKLPKEKKVYVVGMSGIEEELREEGIEYLGGTVRRFITAHLHCAISDFGSDTFMI